MSDVPPPQTSRRQGSAKPLWSDGIHFVRPAAASDRRTMRFVVGHHKTTASTYKRYAPTLDEAVEHAKGATDRWLVRTPVDAVHREISETPETTAETPEVKLTPFATTLFDCIYANPVAQVWQCTALPEMRKPVGRRKNGGGAPVQTPVPHTIGDCAVMRGPDPVRNPDGTVAVFTWAHAEELAGELYENEPPENTISWKPGHVRVCATGKGEVHFNPGIYGASRPFVIYWPDLNRPVYEDRTRATHSRGGIAVGKVTGQARLDLEAARARARAEDRQPSFEERPLRFKSIWSAIEEADRREKMRAG